MPPPDPAHALLTERITRFIAEVGIPQAEAAGPEAHPYPHMLSWLRAAQSAADTS